jgi:Uma2 family endonuclease
MATAEVLLTAEEFYRLPDDGQPKELVRGRIVPLSIPAPRHGYYCGNVVQIVGAFARQHDLGRVMSNDSGVITEREPDTVRGPDVSYYSYLRLPKGPLPDGYLTVSPEIAFEVRSPGDRWKKILAKVLEYLNAGVSVVCVLDPQTQTLTVYREDELQQVLTVDDELFLPELHPDFRVPVRQFFD